MSLERLFLCLVVTAALSPPRAAAQTTILTVPGDSPTIQGAVDMAGPDTLIKVKKGLYEEAVTITGKTNLTLQGKGKPTIAPGAENDAITITGSTGVVVKGFKLENATDGVEISDCASVTISKCLILDMSGIAVHASDSDLLLIEKNKVDGTGDHGLDIGDAPGVTNCSVVKNKVSNTGGHGILLGGDGNLAEKNKVSATGGHGLETRSTVSSNDNTVRLNKVKDAGASGLLINGTGNVFEKNKVNGCEAEGLLITEKSTGNTFSKNKVLNATLAGLSVQGDTNTLTDNKLTKSLADGVLVEGDGNTFEGNKATKSGADGFHVTGTTNTFTANKATGSADLDLEDENGPGLNTYTDNVFPNNNLDL